MFFLPLFFFKLICPLPLDELMIARDHPAAACGVVGSAALILLRGTALILLFLW